MTALVTFCIFYSGGKYATQSHLAAFNLIFNDKISFGYAISHFI